MISEKFYHIYYSDKWESEMILLRYHTCEAFDCGRKHYQIKEVTIEDLENLQIDSIPVENMK
jgi:hypothetical protein